MKFLKERALEHKEYFASNAIIKSAYNFVMKILNNV